MREPIGSYANHEDRDLTWDLLFEVVLEGLMLNHQTTDAPSNHKPKPQTTPTRFLLLMTCLLNASEVTLPPVQRSKRRSLRMLIRMNYKFPVTGAGPSHG